MSVEIRQIQSRSEEYERELALRTRVLREPLGLCFSAEDLARDASDIHLGAFEPDRHGGTRLLGCLLLRPQPDDVVQMRQVAVAPEAQGRGVGRALVCDAERVARAKGFTEMMLHARETVIGFYEALGYSPEGPTFIEVTIPHRTMRKRL